jgi:hypothetical protein
MCSIAFPFFLERYRYFPDVSDLKSRQITVWSRRAAPEDLRSMDVPGGEIGEGTAPLALVLDPVRAATPD